MTPRCDALLGIGPYTCSKPRGHGGGHTPIWIPNKPPGSVVSWLAARWIETLEATANGEEQALADRERDASFLLQALTVCDALDRLLSAIDSGRPKTGRCLDHLPRGPVDDARAALAWEPPND